jgi:HEAT repeat protein
MTVARLLLAVAACAAIAWAVRAIRNVSPIESLTAALRRGDVPERRVAAYELGRAVGDEIASALPALAQATTDPDESVRVAAVESIGGLVAVHMRSRPDEPALDAATVALVAALNDPKPVVRAGAAAAVGGVLRSTSAPTPRPLPGGASTAAAPRRLLDLMRDDSPEVRASAATALGSSAESVEQHDEIALTLLRGLDDDSPDVRWASRLALSQVARSCDGCLSGAIAPAFLEALQKPDETTQEVAMTILAEIGPEAEAAVPPLIRLLEAPADAAKAPSEALRTRAASTLWRVARGTKSAPTAVEALRKTLTDDAPRSVRTTSANALAGFSRSEAAPAVGSLVAVLKATAAEAGPPGPSVAAALGKVAPGDEHEAEAVAALVKALDSPNPFTRLEAAKSLGAFGPKAAPAADRLAKIAEEDALANVRSAARASRDKITGEEPP